MFPQENRLRKERDHKLVFKKGQRYVSPYFVLLVLRRTEDMESPTRFSVIVSKKVNKLAVIRNRIRRVLRESIKSSLNDIKPGFDCIVIARNPVIGKEITEMSLIFRETFEKAGLV